MKLPVDYDSLSPKTKRLVREEYIKLQNNKCAYCGSDLNGDPAEEVLSKPVKERLYPPNFFASPIHLHHDHNTGQTKGAVHCHCNAVLWEYEGE